MRWKLGSYIVRYNPKSSDKSWDAQNQVTINMNGEVSNPNLEYNGTHNFRIDVYEKPTYSTTSSLTGSYIEATESRMNDRMYLLKSNKTFDVKSKNNTLHGTYTIVSGGGVVLPSVSPSSLIHFDTSLAFIYKEASQSAVVITDENGVANRKYIYSTDDLKYGEKIAWDYNSNLIALNPYGKIYSIDKSTGTSSFLYQFSDYDSNLSSTKKRYSSIFMIKKNDRLYIGVLQDGKDLLFIDYITLEIVSKAETNLGNILCISHSDYSGDYFAVFSSKILNVYPNTSRIDIEYLKGVIENGQVTIYDEMNMPSVLSIKDMSVARTRNMRESKYEVSISADIAYTNVGFNNTWANRN